MLEKMGWTKGKGLGLKEDGITAQLEPGRNSGTQGLGYKDKDNYADLASDYEKVLAQLNAKHGSSGTLTGSSSSVSSEGESDHKTKKPLKIRHRYGKIRKKQVSTYSEEDFAKVFAVKVHEWKRGISAKEEVDAEDVQPSVKQEHFDPQLNVKESDPASSDCSKTIVRKEKKKRKKGKVEELETNFSLDDNKMQTKQEDVFEPLEGYEPPVAKEERKKKRRKHEDTAINLSTEKQDKSSIPVQVEDSESIDTANGKKKKTRKKGKGSH